ncbi:hypothetical protein NMY22_g3356 [Coprinellus aureogranulatus]|nr:hypothetical protein NMY22_g3356 [Coprinellus aureogranulatus]
MVARPAGYGVSDSAWTTTDNDACGELPNALVRHERLDVRPSSLEIVGSMPQLRRMVGEWTSGITSLLAYLGMLPMNLRLTSGESTKQYIRRAGAPWLAPEAESAVTQGSIEMALSTQPASMCSYIQKISQKYRISDLRYVFRRALTVQRPGDGFDPSPAHESESVSTAFRGLSQCRKHPRAPYTSGYVARDSLGRGPCSARDLLIQTLHPTDALHPGPPLTLIHLKLLQLANTWWVPKPTASMPCQCLTSATPASCFAPRRVVIADYQGGACVNNLYLAKPL